MIKYKDLILLLLFLLSTVSFSQSLNDNKKEFKKKYSQAVELMQANDFKKAAEIWFNLTISNPQNNNLKFKLGLCYLNIPQKLKEAAFYLEEAAKSFSVKYKDNFSETQAPAEVYYYLAQAYHKTGKYDDALRIIEIYKNLSEKSQNAISGEYIAQLTQAVYAAKRFSKFPLTIEVKNLGAAINTKYSERFPVSSRDAKLLFFISDRPLMQNPQAKDISGYHIYFSVKDQHGNWTEAKKLVIEGGSDNFSRVLSVSADNKKILLLGKDENIYESDFSLSHCSYPKELPSAINSSFRETSASYSKDGKKIFFTSDRTGGKGGLDIWVTVWDSLKTEWATPFNMGDVINSEFDEETPWISDDEKTLVYSSTGHETTGDFDVFISKQSIHGGWEMPANAGFPLNSPFREVSVQPVAENGNTWIISAYRNESLGEDDIFIYSLSADFSRKMVKLTITANSILDLSPLDASIIAYDRNKKEILGKFFLSKSEPNVAFSIPSNEDYIIKAEAAGYLSEEKIIYSDLLKNSETLSVDFHLKKAN